VKTSGYCVPIDNASVLFVDETVTCFTTCQYAVLAYATRAQCLYSLFHRREAKVTGCCNNDRDSAKSTHALQGDIIYSDGYLSIDDVSMVVRLCVMMQVAIAC